MKNFLIKILYKNSINYTNKAIIHKNESKTWNDLYEDVLLYSRYLNNHFKKQEIVVIIGSKSILTTEIILSSISTNHPFVYINNEIPENRQKKIIDGVKATSYIEIVNTQIILHKTEYTKCISHKKNLAYIIFTSGSTGTPKGIKITKRDILNYTKNFIKTFNIKNDTLGNQAPFDFDMGMGDIFISIFSHSTLCLIDRSMFILQRDLIDYLIDNNVTTIIWCVSALCSFNKYDSFSYKVLNLKKIMFIGESMPLKSLEYLRKYIPKAEYINLYGPTETTCASSFFRIIDSIETLPIGKPFRGESLFLLKDGKKIKSPFLNGEICISGNCLADGYLNKEETKKSFKSRFFKKYYKTGDIGFFDKEKNFYFLNRQDSQIKFNGYRIELGEIENIALKNIKEISRCKCIFKNNKIFLFYTGKYLEESILKCKLKKSIPYYMIPTFIYLDDFKYNNSGKIDKQYLEEKINER